jgi:hypothetical protein
MCNDQHHSKTKRINRLAATILLGLVTLVCAQQRWTTVPSPTSQNLHSIAYMSSKFVTVGDSGTYMTSVDGTSWTSGKTGTNLNLLALAAGNNLFVVVGETGTILTSTDGSTWITRTSNTNVNLFSIAWNGTRFVVIGDNLTMLTSTDGITWTSVSFNATLESLNSITYGKSQFVMVGFDGLNGAVFTSTDGLTWTQRSVSASDGLGSVAWTGTSYIAGSFGAIVTSKDGVNWNYRLLQFSTYIVAEAGHNGKTVVTLSGGAIVTSLNDSVWIADTSGVSTNLTSVIWGANKFVAVGEAGVVKTITAVDKIITSSNSTVARKGISAANNMIGYSLKNDADVTVQLYSLQGKLVASMLSNAHQAAGAHTLRLPSLLPAGNYILSLITGSSKVECPVVIVK